MVARRHSSSLGTHFGATLTGNLCTDCYCSTYSIGKERIVKAIAKALNTKVYCDARKTAILRCQSDPELHALLTSDPYAAGVHVVPLGMIASDRFQEYMDKWQGHFGRAVGFRPTGWT